MQQRRGDITPLVDLTSAKCTGPFRTRRPVYVQLLRPFENTYPAGEHIQAWLVLAHADKFRAAWERHIKDNPLPAVHGRVCYHPCESACNRAALDAAVNIHAVERFLDDLAVAENWKFPIGAAQRQTGGGSSAPDRAGFRPHIILRGWATSSKLWRPSRFSAA